MTAPTVDVNCESDSMTKRLHRNMNTQIKVRTGLAAALLAATTALPVSLSGPAGAASCVGP